MKTEFIKEVLSLQNNVLEVLENTFTKDYVELKIQSFKTHNWGKTLKECQELHFDIALTNKNSRFIHEYASNITKEYKIKTNKLSINLFINYITKNTFHNFKQYNKVNKSIHKMVKDLAMNFKGQIVID